MIFNYNINVKEHKFNYKKPLYKRHKQTTKLLWYLLNKQYILTSWKNITLSKTESYLNINFHFCRKKCASKVTHTERHSCRWIEWSPLDRSPVSSPGCLTSRCSQSSRWTAGIHHKTHHTASCISISYIVFNNTFKTKEPCYCPYFKKTKNDKTYNLEVF